MIRSLLLLAMVAVGSCDAGLSRMATPIRKERSEIEEENLKAGAGQFFTPGEAEEKVMKGLDFCLRQTDSATPYGVLECYEDAHEKFPQNSTWAKRIGTIYSIIESPKRAAFYYNTSVNLLFNLARYNTKDDSLNADGGLKFLELFSYKDIKSAIEAGKLMTYNSSYHNRVSEAASIFEFLLTEDRAGDDQQLLSTYLDVLVGYSLFDKIPSVIDKLSQVINYGSEFPKSIMALRMITQNTEAVFRRLLNPSKSEVDTIDTLIRQKCSRSDLPTNLDTYTLKDVHSLISDCFSDQMATKGNRFFQFFLKDSKLYTREGNEGMVANTPLHMLASVGYTDERFIKRLLKMGVDVNQADRFGNTAIHNALVRGHYNTVKVLKKWKGSMEAKSGIQLTPLESACSHSVWIDRTAIAELLEECTDEDICDIEDSSQVIHNKDAIKGSEEQGGWLGSDHEIISKIGSTPKDVNGMKTDSQTDVRSNIEGYDLIVRYLGISKPLLLRRAIYKEQQQHFQKDAFLSKFSQLKGRLETFPRGEMFGADDLKIVTVGDYLAGDFGEKTWTEKVTKTVENIISESEGRKHPLADLIDLTYDFFDVAGFVLGNETAEGYFTIGKTGSGTGAKVETLPGVYALPFGKKQWFLFPPPHAFASKEAPLSIVKSNIDEWRNHPNPLKGRKVIEVTQYPGDILIVPAFWGSVSIDLQESLSVFRKFDIDGLIPDPSVRAKFETNKKKREETQKAASRKRKEEKMKKQKKKQGSS
eukprot:TRINITY_DN6953_c0_g1_i1.p1 TRINITY_DN6953_c0_g1~~TRINITY_DN6953_c0_g1_i1.p1  ORF type:complete len:779 (+),score=189.03 TRINITY_DN6953_c0_g1_i1:68-2338(+)